MHSDEQHDHDSPPLQESISIIFSIYRMPHFQFLTKKFQNLEAEGMVVEWQVLALC